ncbi:activating signal cointegrator 1 complex subunit 3, partial [Linderina macrospora]
MPLTNADNCIPTFTDLLRFRDSRRDRLLSDREATLDMFGVSSESAADKGKGKSESESKSKGKGKGKSVEDDEEHAGQAADNDASHEPDSSQAIWAELHQSIKRERRVNQQLLSQIGQPTTQPRQSSGPLSLPPRRTLPPATIPAILLQRDLSGFVHELEQSQDQQRAQLAAQDSTKYGKRWLIARCQAATAGLGPAAAEVMCTEIFTLLRSDRSDTDIQGQLLELVGFSSMDFLGDLISQRAQIVERIAKESNYAKAEAALKTRALPGVQASIQTASEIALQKEILKEKRKGKRAAHHDKKEETEEQKSAQILGFGADLLRARERQLAERGEEELLPASRKAEQYPHVYTSSGRADGGSVLSMFGTRYSLPVGTTRDEYPDHEEITIPITKPAPKRLTEAPVMIGEMDPLCQYTFRKYTSLNRIQSIIYPTAYGTNENILLSAPTGAGKTDVALLTILRTISQYCSPSPADLDWHDISRKPEFVVAKSDFKIVYVAPMKALAAEVVEKYQSRLKWLGIQCRELTGDMQLTKAEVDATQIIVTTPEKWDVVTRKSSGDVDLVDKVKLLIVDEIHLLNEDRGSVIETLIARTQRQVESRQSMIRLVGLSATLPNYMDVAGFLGVNLHKGMFYFDSGFRPVPLEQHFVGVHGKAGTPATARLLNRVCYDRVQQLVSDGHQVMVFVHARKETVNTAKALRELAMQEGTLD